MHRYSIVPLPVGQLHCLWGGGGGGGETEDCIAIEAC